MAHFAQLDFNNIVINVITVNDKDCLDENGFESEEVGVAFCKSLLGADTIWKQTSYNGNFRGRLACIGGVYDPTRDLFVPPRPFLSWVYAEDDNSWVAPVPFPDDGNWYTWNESTRTWDLVDAGDS